MKSLLPSGKVKISENFTNDTNKINNISKSNEINQNETNNIKEEMRESNEINAILSNENNVSIKENKKDLKKLEKELMNSEFQIIKIDFENVFSECIPKNEYINNSIERLEISNNLFINIYLKPKIKKLIKLKEEHKNKGLKDNEYIVSSKFYCLILKMTSIGHLESCFPEKFSIPRQGFLLKYSRARIVLNKNLDAVKINYH